MSYCGHGNYQWHQRPNRSIHSRWIHLARHLSSRIFPYRKARHASSMQAISDMEQLIRELTDTLTRPSPARIDHLQREIQFLQRQDSAWLVAISLLRNGDSNLRFYGALTLTVKINTSWYVSIIHPESIRAHPISTGTQPSKTALSPESSSSRSYWRTLT